MPQPKAEAAPSSPPPPPSIREPPVVRIITMGLRNLNNCHPSFQAKALVPFADDRDCPPDFDLLAVAVRKALHLPDCSKVNRCDAGTVIDCRDLFEHLHDLKKAADWGHCGLHPANVV